MAKTNSIGVKFGIPHMAEVERRQFRAVFAKWIQWYLTYGPRKLYFSFSIPSAMELVYKAAKEKGAAVDKKIDGQNYTVIFSAPAIELHKGFNAAAAEYDNMTEEEKGAARMAIENRASRLSALNDMLKAANKSDDTTAADYALSQLFDGLN